MKISRLDESPSDFHLLETTLRLQTATMLLRYGEATGETPEAHPRSDQSVLLIQGTVKAEIGPDQFTLRAGDSVIVPAGVKHRFHNAEREAALAFTVYGPPAYPANHDFTSPEAETSQAPSPSR